MNTQQIYTGEDVPIEITLTDSSGTAFNLSSLQGIIAIVFYPDKKRVLKKFSLNSLAGHSALEITDAVNGKFLIKLESADTQSAEEGDLSVEVKIQQENADYTSSTYHKVAVIDRLAHLNDALSRSTNDFD